MLRHALMVVALSTFSLLYAAEAKPARMQKEDIVRSFITAAFSEDLKAVDELTEGEMTQCFHSYVWLKTNLHGQNKEDHKAKPWSGTVTIVGKHREEVLSFYGNINRSEEDIFSVDVDGKPFEVGVSDNNKVVLFNNRKPAPEKK